MEFGGISAVGKKINELKQPAAYIPLHLFLLDPSVIFFEVPHLKKKDSSVALAYI